LAAFVAMMVWVGPEARGQVAKPYLYPKNMPYWTPDPAMLRPAG